MIESKMFKQIEMEFKELCKDLEKENKYKQEICYLFEQALENIKKEHFDIAMFILCVIIESVASKKNYEEFKTFDNWLIEDKEKRLNKFLEEIKGIQNPEEVIKNWHEQYRETYGPRRNFAKIVIETYKTINKVPSFMKFKTENIKGVKTSTYRTGGYKDTGELYKEFGKVIKSIYDHYRSPFAHQGKFLGFDVRIHTKIGGMSVPGSISLQDMAGIALNVMKINPKGD